MRIKGGSCSHLYYRASKLSRMCGIVGYVGYGDTEKVLMSGLSRLESHGYDSAGIAIIDGEGNLDVRKRSGKLQNASRSA